MGNKLIVRFASVASGLVSLGVVFTIATIFTIAGCSSGGSIGVKIVPPAPTATATAAPMVITLGQSTTLSGTCTNSTSAALSGAASGPLTLDASGNWSTKETPAATGNAIYTATCTGSGGSASASVTVTVNAVVATVTGVTGSCTPTTITTDPSSVSQCSGTVTYSNGSTDNNVTFATSPPGTITSLGVFSSTATGTATVTITAAKDTTKSTTATVTVTLPPITISSITPVVQWCVGQCSITNGAASTTFTFTGTNFAAGEQITCSPDTNILYAQLDSPTQATVAMGIDQNHEGSGYRFCKVCYNDNSGCSNAVPLGLYSYNMCGIYPKTGAIFCLNPQETVAGQNLYNGYPLNGYVDQFTAVGIALPNGKIFTGAPVAQMAVDDLTGIIFVDGSNNDENGNPLPGPVASNLPSGSLVGVAAKNGWQCLIQVNTANDLSCTNISNLTPNNPPPAYTNVAVGTDPQSIAMDVIGGKTYAFVVTAGSSPAIWSVDVSDGMTNIMSQPLVGVTANLPAGSGIVMLGAIGQGVVVSYGDKLAIPFGETTLKPTVANPIALPGTPVNILAASKIAIIGNADNANDDGTFTKLDPVAGAATTVSGETSPFMPVGMVVSGSNFLVCPQDGVSNCVTLPLPQ